MTLEINVYLSAYKIEAAVQKLNIGNDVHIYQAVGQSSFICSENNFIKILAELYKKNKNFLISVERFDMEE